MRKANEWTGKVEGIQASLFLKKIFSFILDVRSRDLVVDCGYSAMTKMANGCPSYLIADLHQGTCIKAHSVGSVILK